MREPQPPRWPRALLGAAIQEDVFEPAWHEARAERVERRTGAHAGDTLQTLLLVAQCTALRFGRRGGNGPGGDSVMATMLDDVRYAVRSLRRRPGFAAVAILTLGLGIGANAAIFTVVNGVLLRPLPFEDPDDLVNVQVWSAQGYGISLSMPNHRDWREGTRAFSAMGASAGWSHTYRRPDGARIVRAQVTIGDFFEILGVPALIGRTYTAAEAERGAERIAVLSYDWWQSEFAGDRGVIGTTLILDSSPYTVIGVMPAGFAWPPEDADVFTPMGAIATLPWDDRRSSFGAQAVARLAPGETVASAQADMNRITDAIAEAEGGTGVTAEVEPLDEALVGDTRSSWLLLMGAVVFVLLIAGVNVANLLLVRGEERRREVALRAALGAGRGTIVRQVLAESMVISVAGAVVGLLLAFGGVALIRAWMPLPPIVGRQVAVGGAIVVFTAGLAILAGMAFGLIPALRLSSGIAGSWLREGGRGTATRARQRVRSALVIVETTLAIVLLVGSGLMIASLSNLRNTDIGYDARSVLTARIALAREAYPDRERWRAFHESLQARLEAESGVRGAAVSLLVPLASRSWERLVQPEGEVFDVDGGESVLYNIVSPSWFETLGVPVLRGRAFDERDHNESPPVTIIDESMADLFWPDRDPIGRRITFEFTVDAAGDTLPTWRTVVGVVPNVRHYEMRAPSRVQAYVPLAQTLNTWGSSLYAVVRTTSDAAAFTPVLRRIIADADRNVPMSDVATLEAYKSADMSGDTALSGLLTIFGGVALGLAAIGVFGVMSLLVAQRTREIGVRLAIGARPPQVLGMVLGRTLALAGAGVAFGLVAAGALSRVLTAFLYDLSPLNPVVYAGAAAFLLAVAAGAALIPAMRAARIDPMRTLREEA
jgi:putative ABC transport system permease protein